MSATMSGRAYPTARKGFLWGVCAEIADRAAVPVWLPRMAFVLFAVAHCWLTALMAYLALGWLFRMRGDQSGARFAPRPSSPPPSYRYRYDEAREKFRSLDERLANLEAATVRSEADLRRAFRDLERK